MNGGAMDGRLSKESGLGKCDMPDQTAVISTSALCRRESGTLPLSIYETFFEFSEEEKKFPYEGDDAGRSGSVKRLDDTLRPKNTR